MAFKMKGFSAFKDTGDHKHPHKTGYKPGDELTELNSSEEMRILAAAANPDYAGKGLADDAPGKTAQTEVKRRKAFRAANVSYMEGLGSPTGVEAVEASGGLGVRGYTHESK